jgi:predicted metal-dependent hydrolase
MKDKIQLGDLYVELTRKNIKNAHLSVHPPDGHVSLVAPTSTRLEVAQAYVLSKLPWIRLQQAKFATQARESPREYVKRESHYLWGRRYLLNIELTGEKPFVKLDHKQIHLYIKATWDMEKKISFFYEWQKGLLHTFIQGMIAKWEIILKVKVDAYFVQKMKTRWGSCNHAARHIRLNTELVKKPKDLVEYVIVHEMIHLLEPTHNERFITLMTQYYPNWREARLELNELPLSALK